MLDGVGADGAARHVEQRAQQRFLAEPALHRHAARAFETRATQQVEKHRFGLVVEVVSERDGVRADLREGCAARFTRRRLEALMLFSDFYFYRFERNPQFKAKSRAESSPIARIRAQTMVDVDCGEFVAEAGCKPAQNMQQDYGIDSTRQADRKAFAAQPQRR